MYTVIYMNIWNIMTKEKSQLSRTHTAYAKKNSKKVNSILLRNTNFVVKVCKKKRGNDEHTIWVTEK